MKRKIKIKKVAPKKAVKKSVKKAVKAAKKAVKKTIKANKKAAKKISKQVKKNLKNKKPLVMTMASQLAPQAKLVLEKEWQAELAEAKVEAVHPEITEATAVVAKKALTTPAYSHMFHSVKHPHKPKVEAVVAPLVKKEFPALPKPVSQKEKIYIASGVALFTLLIGGMWLRFAGSYLQQRPVDTKGIYEAANFFKSGLDQIQAVKEELIHNTAAAVQDSTDSKAAIDKANQAYVDEIKKLIEAKNK